MQRLAIMIRMDGGSGSKKSETSLEDRAYRVHCHAMTEKEDDCGLAWKVWIVTEDSMESKEKRKE